MGRPRYELTDFEWSVIEPLHPSKPPGVSRVDDWRLRTGSPRTDIPERYGAPPVCSIRSAAATCCSPIAPTTVMPCREMAARGAWANIKPMPGHKRRPPFSAFLYRYRNLVERFFSKPKHFRAVATRFENNSENYLALVKLASAKIWMRFTNR